MSFDPPLIAHTESMNVNDMARLPPAATGVPLAALVVLSNPTYSVSVAWVFVISTERGKVAVPLPFGFAAMISLADEPTVSED